MKVTPEQLAEYLGDKIQSAEKASDEMRKVAPNSYDSGYDQGQLEALRDVRDFINDELDD